MNVGRVLIMEKQVTESSLILVVRAEIGQIVKEVVVEMLLMYMAVQMTDSLVALLLNLNALVGDLPHAIIW